MKNSTKAKLTALLLVFGATSIAPTVMAGQGHGYQHGGHKVPMMRLMHKLDLTDDQKLQAKELVKTYKQTVRLHKASAPERQEHYDKVQALIKAPSFDEQSARDLASQNSGKHLNSAVTRMKLQHDLYQLLTPEQQSKAEELKTRYKNSNKR